MATAVSDTGYVIVKKGKRPDAQKVKDQLAMLQYCYNTWGIERFAAYFLWILGKREDERARGSGNILHARYVPFILNRIQTAVLKNIGKNNIAVKPRQVGLTTFFLIIRCLLEAIVTPGTNSFLVSQNDKYATKHFVMLKRALKYFGATDPGDKEGNTLMHELHDNLLHTTASNSKEVIFDQLDNFIGIGSAETEEVGQGLTLHRVVCSEVARWPGKPEETLANLKEAIVMEGTLDLESTPNGASGYFHEEFNRATRGLSDFKAHFYEWWWDESYRVGSNDTVGVNVTLTDDEKAEMEADLDADERHLRDKIGLMFEQLKFRRVKKLSLRHNFDEKYPEDPVSCFMLSGSSFFDKHICRARYHELSSFTPWAQKSTEQAQIIENKEGEPSDDRQITGCVFMKRWVSGHRYIIGADPASGKLITGTDTDYSSAKVIDLDTGEHCASYTMRIPPIEFALDLAALGRQYNNALIGVERGTGPDSGGEGGTVITTLVHDCNYGNVYRHKDWTKRARQSKQMIEMEGLPMSNKTRPIALNRLKYFFENSPELVWDITLVTQMMQFTRNEKGRPEGAPGCHDDEVLAAAIAHYVRMVVLGYLNPETKKEQYGATPTEFAAEEELEEVPA